MSNNAAGIKVDFQGTYHEIELGSMANILECGIRNAECGKDSG
jgi:hypothetical protein